MQPKNSLIVGLLSLMMVTTILGGCQKTLGEDDLWKVVKYQQEQRR